MILCQCPERRVPGCAHSPPRSSWLAGFSSREHASKSDTGSTCGRVIPSCPPMCGNRRAALGRDVGLVCVQCPAGFMLLHLPNLTPGRHIEALYSTPPGSAAMTKAGQPRPRDADKVGKGQRKDEEERQDLPDDCCTNLHDPSPVDELRPEHHQPKRRPSEPPSTNMLLPGVGAQANEPAPPPSRCCLPAPPELSVGKKPSTPTKSRSNVQVQASAAADAWPQILKRRVPVTHMYVRFHL